MKILVDATSLLLRSAGIKNYTYHWLQALQARAPGRFDAYPFIHELGKLNHDGSNLPMYATLPRIMALQIFNRVLTKGLDRVTAPYSLFHVSNQVKRPPMKTPVSATIHDLTCWILPETHTAANRAADRLFADRVLKKASDLMAVSEHARQDAIRMLDIHPDKIRTIYSGVPDAYFDAAPAQRAKPYLLYAGTIEPRKNVDLLLSAYRTLHPDLLEQYDLVIAGPQGWHSEETMRMLRSATMKSVHYLGYVPEAEMPGLFAGATAFVYPSLYEGFGFPVAQAMAARVAVITSNTSCLPEVAGNGAITVDPRSRAELTKAMTTMLEHPMLRNQLAEKGRLRSELFRWKLCAEQSIEFFDGLLG